MAGLAGPPIKGLSLLFLKVSDVASSKDNSFEVNGLDIIYALERVSGRGSIECAQRMKNIFRIYCRSKAASDKLSTEGFVFENHQVSLYTHNPFSVRDQSDDTVKIIIGGVPLSVANDEFMKALLDLNVEVLSELKFENYRDRDGKWTDYKTGRRFIYCKKPSLNLKPFTKIGLWNASVYYKGQIRPKRVNQITNEEGSTSNQVNEELSQEDNTKSVVNTNISDSVSEAESPSSLQRSSNTQTNKLETLGKSAQNIPPEEASRSSKDKTKIGKSPVRRGRNPHKRGSGVVNQRQISSLFRRRDSPSTSRSRPKRYFTSDLNSENPSTPKSNSRSN